VPQFPEPRRAANRTARRRRRETRRTGFSRIQIHTRTTGGHRYLGRIEAQGDAEYAATSVMLGETALCLALDKDQMPDHAGVPDTGHRDANRSRHATQVRGPHPGHPADHPVARQLLHPRW
jgi:hypothetical protein